MDEQLKNRNSQRKSDLQEFYIVLDKLHSLALDTDNSVLMDAIAKEKLKLIDSINLAQQQQR